MSNGSRITDYRSRMTDYLKGASSYSNLEEG
jgi:hypothetical protein